jgi:hypothetical protein
VVLSQRPNPSTTFQSGLAGRPTEGGRRLARAEQATQLVVDDELEALHCSVARVQDIVLDRADGSSSLVALLSLVMELLEDHIDATTTNGVRRST